MIHDELIIKESKQYVTNNFDIIYQDISSTMELNKIKDLLYKLDILKNWDYKSYNDKKNQLCQKILQVNELTSLLTDLVPDKFDTKEFIFTSLNFATFEIENYELLSDELKEKLIDNCFKCSKYEQTIYKDDGSSLFLKLIAKKEINFTPEQKEILVEYSKHDFNATYCMLKRPDIDMVDKYDLVKAFSNESFNNFSDDIEYDIISSVEEYSGAIIYPGDLLFLKSTELPYIQDDNIKTKLENELSFFKGIHELRQCAELMDVGPDSFPYEIEE